MDNIQIETIAALDLGANFFRMIIAEIGSDGEIKVLEELQKIRQLEKILFQNEELGLKQFMNLVIY